MHGFERLARRLAQNSNGIDHNVDAFQSGRPLLRVQVAREIRRDRILVAGAALDAQNTMACDAEGGSKSLSDEAARARHHHPHTKLALWN